MPVKSSTKKRLIELGIAGDHAIGLATDANLDAILGMSKDEIALRTGLQSNERELERIIGILENVRLSAYMTAGRAASNQYRPVVVPKSLLQYVLPMDRARQLVILGIEDEHAEALTKGTTLDNISRWKRSTVSKRTEIGEETPELNEIMNTLKLLQMSLKIRQAFVFFKNGFSISDVSGIMGVNRGTAYSWHRKLSDTGVNLPEFKRQPPWKGEATPEKLQQIVDYLVEGHDVEGVAKIMELDVLVCAIWLEFPEFKKAWANGPSFIHWKYTVEEAIHLAKINPHYGFGRFIATLYPNKGVYKEYFYEFTLLFNDYKEFTGTDLIKILEGEKPNLQVSGKARRPLSNFNWGNYPPEKDRRKRWGNLPSWP